MPRVTLAYPWTDQQGQSHNQEDTVDVDAATAVDLHNRGWARPADEPKKGGK